MHLAAIKSVLHALETIDLLSGQGGQILLGTQRTEHMERSFKTESFVHPRNGKQFTSYHVTSLTKIRLFQATSDATG